MVCAPDGTRQPACSVFAGISWNDSGPIRESSRKLQIGAAIELPQSLEAELADPLRLDLALSAQCGFLDPVGDRLQLARIHVALVGSAHQTAEQLLAVERLTLSVPLDHDDLIGDGPLEGGEAVAAAGALAAAAKSGAVLGVAGLQGPGGGLAAWTVHCRDDS